MASGFFALLDDIAVIAKAAAASLDDVALQTAQATKKAVAVVIDDTAVTPRYVVGLAAERELPIIARIAWGSFKNKTLYLLPLALALSFFTPWLITPLLMIGGAYLCLEGYEKLHDLLHRTAGSEPQKERRTRGQPFDEDAKVARAIRTDFVLSAEIVAISLASVTAPDFFTKAAVLTLVGLVVTAGVYGMVALIVKADDFGAMLARHGRLSPTRALGRGIVAGMPSFLSLLSFVGMLAMLWVGGGIILHGLEGYGLGALTHAIDEVAQASSAFLGPFARPVAWLIQAAASGIVGLAVGAAIGVLGHYLGGALGISM